MNFKINIWGWRERKKPSLAKKVIYKSEHHYMRDLELASF